MMEVDETATPARALLIRQGMNPDETIKVAGEDRRYEDILTAALQEIAPKKEAAPTISPQSKSKIDAAF